MHSETVHHVTIRAPQEHIFHMCADVAQWPDRFPPCQAVEILEDSGTRQRVRITALANGKPMTWVSERALDRQRGTIVFQQVEPQAPVIGMSGTWTLRAIAPEQTLVTLAHRVEVDSALPEAEANLQHMLQAIHANSQVELDVMRRQAEMGVIKRFADAMTIQTSARTAYDHLWRAEQWSTLLPHCSDVAVSYDDGVHQELVMQVDTPRGQETIRTIRTGVAPQTIHYFQPEPPAPIAVHQGSWSIAPGAEAGTVNVVGEHTIRLQRWTMESDVEEATQLAQVEEAIRQNTRGTLQAVARASAEDA